MMIEHFRLRQATLQEQEAAFRKKELKLVREKQDAMESLNASSSKAWLAGAKATETSKG